MKNGSKILLGSFLALLSLGTVGCGSYSKATTEAAALTNSVNTTTQNQNSSGSSNSGSGTVIIPSLGEPFKIAVGATGNTGEKTVSVRAKNVLKVKFIPGIQNQQTQSSGNSPQYSKLSVKIRVGETEVETPMISNGYPNQTAESSDAYDFSAEIPSCGTSTSCRSSVTITVGDAWNDYWYLLSQSPEYWGLCWYYPNRCPSYPVWDSHPWNGTLVIQTDDTNAI